MPDLDAPISSRTVTSRDGTRIHYDIIGDGPRLWIMPPAMGAPLVSMKYIIERFRRAYTIVSWDMRGFYRSEAPPEPTVYDFERHMEDMLAVCDAVRGVGAGGGFILGGWSMGVQLSLEYYRRAPEDVRALVLINGPYEHALTGSLPMRVPGADAMVSWLLFAAGRAGPFLNLLSRRLLGAPSAARVLEGVGYLAANAPFFQQVLEDFHRIDWGRYLYVMRGLNGHSAADVLPTVRVPTLITAGQRDIVTPVRVARRMHASIAGSELVVLPRATHYVPAEFPDELNAAIERFLAGVG